jgi:hypothetical protein
MSSSRSSSQASSAASTCCSELLASASMSASPASSFASSSSSAVCASDRMLAMRCASEICSFVSLTACAARDKGTTSARASQRCVALQQRCVDARRACITRCASIGVSHKSLARQRCSKSARTHRKRFRRHTCAAQAKGSTRRTLLPASLAAFSGKSTTCAARERQAKQCRGDAAVGAAPSASRAHACRAHLAGGPARPQRAAARPAPRWRGPPGGAAAAAPAAGCRGTGAKRQSACPSRPACRHALRAQRVHASACTPKSVFECLAAILEGRGGSRLHCSHLPLTPCRAGAARRLLGGRAA